MVSTDRRNFALAALGAASLSLTGCLPWGGASWIYGKWRSERLSFGGIAIPVAPFMEFKRKEAVIDGERVAVDDYEVDGPRVTVHLQGAPSLTFLRESEDKMSIELPILGKILYSRVS